MSTGRKYHIEEHLSEDKLNELLKEYKQYYIVYRRLLFINMLYKDYSIKEASEILGINSATGGRWLNSYNDKGFEGLFSNYSNCGRKSELTEEEMEKLNQYILDSEDNLTLKMIRKWINDEFNVLYSEKQVWVIVRQKLGFNYGKPFIKYSKKPKDAEKQLKKTQKT